MPRLTAVAAAAVAALLLLALVPAADARVASPVGQAGRWLVDAQGRVLTLQGVNMVAKRPPYLPSALGFGEDDARFLADHGFDTVRLGVIYKAVEPEPGRYDDAYLDAIGRTVDLLAAHGIQTQLDLHQDLFHERFQGEGFPDWAVLDDGLPAEPKAGFPNNYLLMPALSRAFDSFFSNRPGPGGVGLADRFAAAWGHIAERLGRRPGLIGYDLLNEPWPGQAFATCIPLGCPEIEARMDAVWRKAAAAIRAADPEAVVWYEPPVLFNFGAGTTSRGPSGRTGFSFHVYCLQAGSPAGETQAPEQAFCPPFEQLAFQNAVRQAGERSQAVMLTEFGATQDLAEITRVAKLAEDALIGWHYWHFCECADPTTSGSGGTQSLVPDPALPPAGDNVRAAKLRVLARPHPRAVAGTPSSARWDPERRRFGLRFRTARAGGGSFARGVVTEVAVPRLQYPDGYVVEAVGAEVVSPARSGVLRVRTREDADEVRVLVRPGEPEGFPRVAPGPLRARTTRALRTTGTLALPEGTDPREGCRGRVRVDVRAGGRRVGGGTGAVRADCTFRVRSRVRAGTPRRVAVRARFGGNDVLLARSSVARTVRR